MATRITVQGDSVEVLPGPSVLEDMQAVVGGLIEFVYFKDGSALMVNEEGQAAYLESAEDPLRTSEGPVLQKYPFNPVASALCAVKGRPTPITGNAMFFTAAEMRAMEEE